ncbi:MULTISPECIES: caspase family protein [Streptomyces]|uniref:Peptidase C14 caspase domain-containing protein n=1 Tax=Streptomyces luteosporeus TaxID=173856 RepID=A0ABN3TTV8_9ACTN
MTGDRHALIVANDTYADEGLSRLRAPAQDAVALAEVLADPAIGGFDVQVVRNEPAHVVALRIEDFFCDRRRDDTLLLHLSCHGLKSVSGELYFAATDTRPERLTSTAVSAGDVRRLMSGTLARSIVLFLDCCYGGAFPKGMAARAAGDVGVLDRFEGGRSDGGRGWAVITAATGMQFAFEDNELTEARTPRPSLFTGALVRGLSTGEADRDEDGRISLDELYDYVSARVRRENPHQTPTRSVDMQGDLYIARSGHRRVVPAPVPDPVRAAMTSDDIFTRRGAIAELRSCLESTDLPVAAGARDALAEMARKDIRSVATEAGRVLDEMALRARPDRLEFAAVPRGTPAPHGTVQLLGPPLARAAVVRPTEDWLRVMDSPEGLDVSVDTSRTGRFSGDVVLKGAGGEAVVHVDAEVVAAPPPPPDVPPGRTPQPSPQPAPERRREAEHPQGQEPPRAPRPAHRAQRATGLAAAAAVLGLTSVITFVVAAVAASDAVRNRVVEGGTQLEDQVAAAGMLTPLNWSITTAMLALIAVPLARRALTPPGGTVPSGRPARLTSFLCRTAKAFAIPALVLAVTVLVAFLVAAHYA